MPIFFISNEILGGVPDETLPSTLYFCPTCGDVWARLINAPDWWTTFPRPCPRHGPPFLLQYDPVDPTRGVPASVLARELVLALDWMDATGKSYPIYLITGGK